MGGKKDKVKAERITKMMYGKVSLTKGYCPNCETDSVIIDGEIQCCDSVVTNLPEYGELSCSRAVTSKTRRKKISQKVKQAILDEQGGSCVYCDVVFGDYILDTKRNTHHTAVPQYDHFVAFSYDADDDPTNLVASCQFCNAIKAAKRFNNLIEARLFILERRKKKGLYNICDVESFK